MVSFFPPRPLDPKTAPHPLDWLAQVAQPAGAATLTTRNAACFTPGYADPIIINGGEYSVITDGYAVGITNKRCSCCE